MHLVHLLQLQICLYISFSIRQLTTLQGWEALRISMDAATDPLASAFLYIVAGAGRFELASLSRRAVL